MTALVKAGTHNLQMMLTYTEDPRSMSSAIIVPVLKTERIVEGQTQAEIDREETIQDEGFHCVLALVSLGQMLDDKHVLIKTKYREKMRELVPDIEDRMQKSYAILLFLAEKVRLCV